MVNVRQWLRVCSVQAQRSYYNPRLIVTMALTAVLTTVFVTPFTNLSAGMRSPCNVLEPFIIMGNDEFYLMIYNSGLLLLLCNAPFYEKGESLYLCHTGRKCWLAGKLLFTAFATLLYYAFVLCVSIFMAAGSGYLADTWSSFARLTYTSTLSNDYHLGLILRAKVAMELTPYQAFLNTFCLVCLYGYITVLIQFAINLRFHNVVGFLAACVPSVWGFVIFPPG